jgi:hypothetical protein
MKFELTPKQVRDAVFQHLRGDLTADQQVEYLIGTPELSVTDSGSLELTISDNISPLSEKEAKRVINVKSQNELDRLVNAVNVLN